jgi:hypothetical protein
MKRNKDYRGIKCCGKTFAINSANLSIHGGIMVEYEEILKGF